MEKQTKLAESPYRKLHCRFIQILNKETEFRIHENDYNEITKEIALEGKIDKIIEMLDILQAKLKYIYLTHCHGDHIGAVNQLKNETGAIVLIHRADAKGLTDDKISLATYIGMNEVKVTEFSRVDDGDLIHIGNLEFLVIHTPRTY